MNDEYPTWIHVIAGLIGFAAIAGISLLSFLLFAPADASAATIIHGTCSPPFSASPRQICTACLGQDFCADGTLTPVREEPVFCSCQRRCEWTDGSVRSTCAACSGERFVYEGESSDALCADHGGVADSRWSSSRYLQDAGLWNGPDSPPTAGALPGPDLLECHCLSGRESACVAYDAGPGPGVSEDVQGTLCRDVCSWTKGTLSISSQYASLEHDSRNCVQLTDDRGPEVHCQCDGAPLKETWCTDDSGACADHGCEVHHTAPSSTRCVPVPSESDSDSDLCVGSATPATAGLNWLRFGVGLSHDCVDALR